MKDNATKSTQEKQSERPSFGNSIFASLLFIGAGVYLILNNLGILDDVLHWSALLPLWPVLLIFAGLGILAQQIPGRAGFRLSGLVSTCAFVFLVAILLFGDHIPLVSSFAITEVIREDIAVQREGAETAEVSLNLASQPVSLTALQDSPNLLDGTISHTGQLNLQERVNGNHATIVLGVSSVPWWQQLEWSGEDNWRIGLNSSVATALHLDIGSGPGKFDLSQLTLTEVNIDGGSGPANIEFPAGNYTIAYDVGSGGGTIELPNNGQIDLEIDGGSGSIDIFLPNDMEAYIEIDGGSGSWRTDDERLQLVEQNGKDSVWQTADYTADAPNRLHLKLDIGSGSILFIGQ